MTRDERVEELRVAWVRRERLSLRSLEARRVADQIAHRGAHREGLGQRGIHLQRSIDFALRVGVLLQIQMELRREHVRVGIARIHGQRTSDQRIGAGRAIEDASFGRAEESARFGWIRLQNVVERALRVGAVVLLEEHLAQRDASVVAIGRVTTFLDRTVERLERIL